MNNWPQQCGAYDDDGNTMLMHFICHMNTPGASTALTEIPP